MGEANRRGTAMDRRGAAIRRAVRRAAINALPQRYLGSANRNVLAEAIAYGLYAPHLAALHPRAGDALPPSAPAGRRPADLSDSDQAPCPSCS